jgi:hypothetical protein
MPPKNSISLSESRKEKISLKKRRSGEIAWLELVDVLFRGLAVFLGGTIVAFLIMKKT